MSNQVVFETVRPWLDPKGFTAERIAALDAACEALRRGEGMPPAPITVEGKPRRKLADATAFFDGVRKVTGSFNLEQKETIDALLVAAAHWRASWLAYGLATAWHEARLEPIEEWGKGKGRPYSKPGKYGQSQHGRGLVQLTWDANYEWADAAASKAGLIAPGELLKDFNRALEPELATFILVKGMEDGAFCRDASGRRHDLARYLPRDRAAAQDEFVPARRIINGTDKAEKIASEAVGFQRAVLAGGWG